MLKLLLIFLFTIFSFSNDQNGYTCDEGWTITQNSTAAYEMMTDCSYWVPGMQIGETIVTTPTWQAIYVKTCTVYESPSGLPENNGARFRQINYQCPSAHYPSPPSCPENEDYNLTSEQCECPTPRWYDLNGAHCDPIQCPIDFDGKTLRQQNDTAESCFNSYPPAIYDTRYVGEEEAGLPITCCYAKDNTTPEQPVDPTCDAGYHLDTLGRCVEDGIPPLELPTCTDGQVWDNFSQVCKDDPNAVSSGGDEGGQASDGNDYNTTAGDTPYNGGDNAATDSVVLEYNSDEVNDMLNNYSGEIEGKFGGFIKEMQNSVLTFYEISIPLSPSCGCSDIPIDVTLLGQQYNETVEICSSLDSLFSIITPLLWFVFLVGNLFAFFRGGN